MPRQHKWDAEYGYKQRNLDIARESDVVHVIVADQVPEGYSGMEFRVCYHCARSGPGGTNEPHVKSGGCWTGIKAMEAGNRAEWHIIENYNRRDSD